MKILFNGFHHVCGNVLPQTNKISQHALLGQDRIDPQQLSRMCSGSNLTLKQLFKKSLF